MAAIKFVWGYRVSILLLGVWFCGQAFGYEIGQYVVPVVETIIGH